MLSRYLRVTLQIQKLHFFKHPIYYAAESKLLSVTVVSFVGLAHSNIEKSWQLSSFIFCFYSLPPSLYSFHTFAQTKYVYFGNPQMFHSIHTICMEHLQIIIIAYISSTTFLLMANDVEPFLRKMMQRLIENFGIINGWEVIRARFRVFKTWKFSGDGN